MSQQKSGAVVGDSFPEADVVAYLRSHPDFFERHTPLLLRLKLPHETGPATISLVERQVAMLRQRSSELERQLKNFLSVAKANEALAMIEETCGPLARASGCEFACITFGDLVVAAAEREGATLLIRGLRSASDFDYEMEMAGMNASMAPALQTVFLPASPNVRPITATLVRQIASMGGDVRPFVPAVVAAALARKFGAG